MTGVVASTLPTLTDPLLGATKPVVEGVADTATEVVQGVTDTANDLVNLLPTPQPSRRPLLPGL
ncbi:hypothetical protein D3C72_2482160 [compost metagenome]